MGSAQKTADGLHDVFWTFRTEKSDLHQYPFHMRVHLPPLRSEARSGEGLERAAVAVNIS